MFGVILKLKYTLPQTILKHFIIAELFNYLVWEEQHKIGIIFYKNELFHTATSVQFSYA